MIAGFGVIMLSTQIVEGGHGISLFFQSRSFFLVNLMNKKMVGI